MIPKLSAPLVKDIRTGEGVLEWILAVLGVLAGATGNLSVSHTALYLTIIAVSKGVRRLLLKVVAVQAGVGIGVPLEPAVLGQVSTMLTGALASGGVIPAAEDVLKEIAGAQSTAAAVQAAPGASATEVKAGLSPTAPLADPGATVK